MSHALTVTALTRWEVRRAIRLGVPSDFRIAAQGARHSDGAIATVYVRDGREATCAGHARLVAAAPELLAELRAAHQVIRHALALMTTEQKIEWGRMNAAAGVEGEGVTRANERGELLAHLEGVAA